jgi:diadenosine tetraphosphate (Ap4A) HIT family hydrolase
MIYLDLKMMYYKDNIFAKIINNIIPARKIYEDDRVLVIEDINPVAPIHLLVMPKGEYIDYSDFILKAEIDEIRHYFSVIMDVIKQLELKENSYRLITNKGFESGQTIFHFHFHIIAGMTLDRLL